MPRYGILQNRKGRARSAHDDRSLRTVEDIDPPANLGTFEAMNDTFDEHEARSRVGKRLLIGVTLRSTGEVVSNRDFVGSWSITTASEEDE